MSCLLKLRLLAPSVVSRRSDLPQTMLTHSLPGASVCVGQRSVVNESSEF